ncbi:hypothetical protein CCR85_06095 [Rhodothalassium salexigens]|nr:hypothetical protein [Rhodothalassium salexigens]
MAAVCGVAARCAYPFASPARASGSKWQGGAAMRTRGACDGEKAIPGDEIMSHGSSSVATVARRRPAPSQPYARTAPSRDRASDQAWADPPTDIGSHLVAELRGRQDRTRRYLHRRLGDADEAEDVWQEFCLTVWRKGHQVRDPAALNSWLNRVLHTVLVDHVRREGARRHAHARLAVEPSSASVAAEPASDSLAAPDRFDRLACSCFYRLLPRLKSEYADALARVDLGEEERAAVARDLGITPVNMRVRLHRARGALREALRHSCTECRVRACFGGASTEDGDGG